MITKKERKTKEQIVDKIIELIETINKQKKQENQKVLIINEI